MFGGSVFVCFQWKKKKKKFNERNLSYGHFLQENQHTIMPNLTDKRLTQGHIASQGQNWE